MQAFRFLIADWCVCVDYRNDDDIRGLIPSFAPFVYRDVASGGDAAMSTIVMLTCVTVDDGFRFEARGEEMGQFDCGGANHGVYRTAEGGYQYEISDPYGKLCCIMQSNCDFSAVRVALMTDVQAQRSYGLNNALMLAYAFAAADKGTLLMHSSVIRNGGRGFMFLGKSGTGKSTHTRLWRENIPGSDLLNDDNPVLRYIDGRAIVYGSPWSGKTPCYRNLSVPVAGITLLEQKPYNRIERQNVFRALAAIMPSPSNMKWDHRVYNGVMNTLSDVIGCTPVYVMGCLPNADAARVSYDEQCRH